MEHSFQFKKTFRFETLNEDKNPTKVLYVLHGYGQLVQYFIRKFSSLNDNILIVAPEGMHRFYLNGTSGRVGASWMTKEARLTDIDDTIEFLNEVDRIVTGQFNITERHLLGFSQGGATAARWEQMGNVSFESITLWGCVFPPDLEISSESLKTKEKYFVIGDKDQYFDANAQEQLIDHYSKLDFSTQKYEGGHDIDNRTLTSLIDKIESNR